MAGIGSAVGTMPTWYRPTEPNGNAKNWCSKAWSTRAERTINDHHSSPSVSG
ncbi:hypothetical protein HWC69_gp095 [Gordonia phage Ranch]|uniref:Uncharacterized protein n=1 Tax=Gordonia phage Ranch TaxID=2599848 RepID=A0A5J6TQZ5_9CAUD|nr:hypothetical protein HWC69_gp095 [Gordonia phage Ranch]QFG12397.1 hypothetical protein PBI_RANCH_95 [Gordonia phage Ranch]